MLQKGKIPSEYLETVKRQLNITWTDSDIDEKLLDMMMDAEAALNHILGAEINYFSPGMARRLYLNYMIYAWNDCLNEFEQAYRAEIIRLRHYFRITEKKNEE